MKSVDKTIESPQAVMNMLKNS